MQEYVLTVPPACEGKRLDLFLSESADGLSRSAAQQLCEAGRVFCGGLPGAKNLRLKAGSEVRFFLSDPVKLDAFPEDIPLEIVYEDEHLVVVNKPQGMVVHPAPGNPDHTLVNALLYHCRGQLSSINGVIRPGIVHRIDKDTSGLLVVAKDDRTHEGLAEQFSCHSIDRIYYAVVHGALREDEGTVDRPIGRNPNDRKKMCVTEKNARRAVTHYAVVERFRAFSLVRLQLETGRTHQIRVHMASLGHPVAGDPVYGPAKGVKGLHGQCLHAAVLGFIHPVSGEHLLFETPLPDYFSDFLARLRKGETYGPV